MNSYQIENIKKVKLENNQKLLKDALEQIKAFENNC